MLLLLQALRALNVSAVFNPSAANLNRLSEESLFITDVMQSVRRCIRIDTVKVGLMHTAWFATCVKETCCRRQNAYLCSLHVYRWAFNCNCYMLAANICCLDVCGDKGAEAAAVTSIMAGATNTLLLLRLLLLQVVVIVDEVGTEAAAVTSIMVGATAFIQETTPPIVFDRPFIFMLVDDSSSNVLFMGIVKDPTQMSVK
jgi:serine protease inhibitor